MANTEFPGSMIQYSLNGGLAWYNYTVGVKLNGTNNPVFSVV